VLKLRADTAIAGSHVRLLGVDISLDLSVDRHVSRVCAGCFYRLRQLRRIRRSLDSDSLATLIYAVKARDKRAGLPSRAARPGNPARLSRDPCSANFPSKIHCTAMLFRWPAGEVRSCVAAPVQPGRAYYVVFLLNLFTV